MRKIVGIKIFFLSIFMLNNIFADSVSHSFISSNNIFAPIAKQDLLFDQHNDIGRVLKKNNIEVSFFAGNSNASNKLNKYFLFNNKDSLICRFNAPTTMEENLMQDILVADLNVAKKNFVSTIKFAPKQSISGSVFAMRFCLSESTWLSFNIPILKIRNNLNLCESISNEGLDIKNFKGIDKNDPVFNATNAFKQSGFDYGKIDGIQEKIGFSDVAISIGHEGVNRSDLYMATSAGIIIPFSNKPNAKYLFEPILGNNGHFGIAIESLGQFNSKKFKNCSLWSSWSAKSEYLFENTQKRSFDLNQKPFSRYIAVYKDDLSRSKSKNVNPDWDLSKKSFGINYLTRDVLIKPNFAHTMHFGLDLISDKFYIGIGSYTLIKQKESAELAQTFERGPMIASYHINKSNSALRNISTEVDANDDNDKKYPINSLDLDFDSILTPTTISQSPYIHLGYSNKDKMFGFELGYSYRYGHDDSVINGWQTFCSIHSSF